MRKAWIHCKDGDGFRVDCYKYWSPKENAGLLVSAVFASDESQANIVAENWEKEGILSYERQG